MKIDLLCIGHCCHDKVNDTNTLGGTTSYSALLANSWNQNTAILTSLGKDFQFLNTFQKIDIPMTIKWAPQTTTFENKYIESERTQYLLARAESIDQKDIPNDLLEVPVVHFGPIADEIDPIVFSLFKNSLKGLSIQGMLRTWDTTGLVKPKAMDWTILNAVDIVFLSDEDIRGKEEYLDHIVQNCNHVVQTHGADGATVFTKGNQLFLPSFPSNEVDPTGAGDTFTTAYLLDYYNHKDVRSACIFAHCASSFIIETKGLSELPQIGKVQARCLEYTRIFASFL